MKDKSNLKWKNLIDEEVRIPTFWNKERYDSLTVERQKRAAEYRRRLSDLRANKASEAEIEKLENRSRKMDEAYRLELKKMISDDKIGAYEGAGYLSKGMYRSQLNCIMRSSDAEGYCRVCTQRIVEMIRYYSE
jgi:hypothetical protein